MNDTLSGPAETRKAVVMEKAMSCNVAPCFNRVIEEVVVGPNKVIASWTSGSSGGLISGLGE